MKLHEHFVTAGETFLSSQIGQPKGKDICGLQSKHSKR